MHARRALAAVVTALLLAGTGAAGARAGAAHPPASWDPRVVPLVHFVEATRGHRFDHPVAIEYLDDRAFVRELGSDRYVGVYRSSSQTIVIRGRALTPSVEVTLVHELTHALDDQRFDLDRLGGRRAASPDERLARRGVIEASASLVEEAYLASLPAAERAEAGGLARSSAPYRVEPAFVAVVAASRSESVNDVVDELLADPPRGVSEISAPR